MSGGADRTILIADVSTGKVIKKYHKHSSVRVCLFVYEYLFAVVLYSCLNMFEVYTDILAYRGLIV